MFNKSLFETPKQSENSNYFMGAINRIPSLTNGKNEERNPFGITFEIPPLPPLPNLAGNL